MTPSYLKNKLPRHRRPLYRRNNVNSFHEIMCNFNRYKNSFFPDGIKTWNTVIDLFPELPTMNILKKFILSLIRPKKKSIFDIYDPLGIRHLFYLRLELSPLRSHKNKHGFLDAPTGDCLCANGIEDTNHFLFLCPLYKIQRATLIASVTPILRRYNLLTLVNKPHLYLYGNSDIPFADNKNIILSSLCFIKETQRFSI